MIFRHGALHLFAGTISFVFGLFVMIERPLDWIFIECVFGGFLWIVSGVSIALISSKEMWFASCFTLTTNVCPTTSFECGIVCLRRLKWRQRSIDIILKELQPYKHQRCKLINVRIMNLVRESQDKAFSYLCHTELLGSCNSYWCPNTVPSTCWRRTAQNYTR